MSKDLENMNARTKTFDEALLELVSNEYIAWTCIKLCAAYKYVQVFI